MVELSNIDSYHDHLYMLLTMVVHAQFVLK